jgi:hypothetical protein
MYSLVEVLVYMLARTSPGVQERVRLHKVTRIGMGLRRASGSSPTHRFEDWLEERFINLKRLKLDLDTALGRHAERRRRRTTDAAGVRAPSLETYRNLDQRNYKRCKLKISEDI